MSRLVLALVAVVLIGCPAPAMPADDSCAAFPAGSLSRSECEYLQARKAREAAIEEQARGVRLGPPPPAPAAAYRCADETATEIGQLEGAPGSQVRATFRNGTPADLPRGDCRVCALRRPEPPRHDYRGRRPPSHHSPRRDRHPGRRPSTARAARLVVFPVRDHRTERLATLHAILGGEHLERPAGRDVHYPTGMAHLSVRPAPAGRAQALQTETVPPPRASVIGPASEAMWAPAPCASLGLALELTGHERGNRSQA